MVTPVEERKPGSVTSVEEGKLGSVTPVQQAAPAEEVEEVPDNTAKFRDLKVKLAKRKEDVELQMEHIVNLMRDAEKFLAKLP